MESTATATLRRRWIAVGLGTFAYQLSYWPVVYGVTASAQAIEGTAAALAFGLALVPLVFAVVAFSGRVRRAPGAVLRAMGLFLIIGVPLVFVSAVIGLVAGFGAGGAVALWRDEEALPTRARAVAVAAGTAYVFLLLVTFPQFGLLTGAVVPFAVLGLADQAAEIRAHNRSGTPAG